MFYWLKKKAPKKTCKWRQGGIHALDKSEYRTECGKEFFDSTESGQPVTDWATYCPYCGGEIKL